MIERRGEYQFSIRGVDWKLCNNPLISEQCGILYPTTRTLYPRGGGRLFTCRLRGLRLTIPFVAPHMPARITAILPRYHNQLPELKPAFQPLPASSPLFSPIFFFFLLFLLLFSFSFSGGEKHWKNGGEEGKGRASSGHA